MGAATEIKVPSLGESVSEATVARWLKQPGDNVKADEAIVELETDKVTLEVNAPQSGVLKDVKAQEGSTVEVGDLLALLEAGAVAKEAPTATAAPAEVSTPAPSPAKASSAPTTSSSTSSAEKLSPAVRKGLEEKNLKSSDVVGSGPDGRILKGDVIDMKSHGAAPWKGDISIVSLGDHPNEERVPMTRLRRTIAKRLKDAQNTAAMLTTFNEIDMTHLMEARKRYKDSFEKKYGVKLGFMSFFIKAAIVALKEIPAVNAEIDGDDIVYKNHYDIGVAVSAPQGLIVPVIRDADHLSFAQTEQTLGALAQKARDGTLSMNEMMGGTFTVTNGGIFGSLMSTPILNPPQSGILGMHKVQERPVVVDGQIQIRPMMYVALSYDHRIIDGREAVTFLVRVKECLEDPERILLAI